MNVIERIERGEITVYDMADCPQAFTELLRLAKIGQQMQWAPVTPDTMPEHEQDCIICTTDNEVLGGFMYCNEPGSNAPGFYGKRVAFDVEQVTHWMKLPPLPPLPELTDADTAKIWEETPEEAISPELDARVKALFDRECRKMPLPKTGEGGE